MSAIFSWRRERRVRAVLRDLRALNPADLAALGLRPTDFDRLARKSVCR